MNTLSNYLEKIDKALTKGNLRSTLDLALRATKNIDAMSLTDIIECTKIVVLHLKQDRVAVPTGYREIIDRLFTKADTLIKGNPERHRLFADEVSSLSDLNLPWHLLNLSGRGISVLYNFVPFADTGASVASKRIRERGAPVDVISCSSLGRKNIDQTPLRVSSPYIRQMVTLNYSPSWASWGPQEDFIKAALRWIEQSITRGTVYDFVYTRAMWAPSHYVGASLKIARPEISWIAEFSDPLSLDVEGNARAEHPPVNSTLFNSLVEEFQQLYGNLGEADMGIFRMAELLPYAFADEVVFTNRLQMQTMLEHVENDALKQRIIERAVVSNHPTLPRQYYVSSPNIGEMSRNKVNLGYFGQFYATRGLGDITRAMRMLPREYLEHVRLHVFTTYVPKESGGRRPISMNRRVYEDYVQRTVDSVGDSGLTDQVVLHPSLPYLQFLGVLDQFDYLIVNDAKSGQSHTVNPYLPSKYGDYLGSQSKIWAIHESESCLSASTADLKTPLGDANEVRRILMSVIEDKIPGLKSKTTARNGLG